MSIKKEMERHLIELLNFISKYQDNELYFSLLYARLLKEIEFVIDDISYSKRYLGSLIDTKNVQALGYIETKKRLKKRSNKRRYQLFITNFRISILEELSNLKFHLQ